MLVERWYLSDGRGGGGDEIDILFDEAVKRTLRPSILSLQKCFGIGRKLALTKVITYLRLLIFVKNTLPAVWRLIMFFFPPFPKMAALISNMQQAASTRTHACASLFSLS